MQGRVLVADDNPAVRKTLRHLLEDSGACVADAEEGQSAISRAIEFHPDIVILDLAMPVMDGLSAAREISRILPEAAILMYTMHWSPHLELEAKKCGVRMLVSKEQSIVLLTAVQTMLAAKQSASQSASNETTASATPLAGAASTLPSQEAAPAAPRGASEDTPGDAPANGLGTN